MKIIAVVLVVIGVWIAGSFLVGFFIFSSTVPSQPVVRTHLLPIPTNNSTCMNFPSSSNMMITHLLPKPTNNSTAAAVISSSIDIGAAVSGLHGAPYPVVNLSVPSGALVDYLLPDGQYSAVVQTGGTFRSLIVGHGISTTYAVISKPIATFRGAKSV